MKKFKYVKISKNKKIRIIYNFNKSNLFIVFLHGLKSDLTGKKPNCFLNFCKKRKINFLALEYSGHGKSYGKFEEGNISTWSKNTKFIINKFIKKKNFLIIGSSMGSWVGLNMFKHFNKQIKGFIGIGSAPEFTQKLMWNKFSRNIKKKILREKLYIFKKDGYEYPITYQFIKDGKKNKVLDMKIKSRIFVSAFHGKKDKVVPVIYSRKLLNLFVNAKKKLFILKNGDHSLSNKKNLKFIIRELNDIIFNII